MASMSQSPKIFARRLNAATRLRSKSADLRSSTARRRRNSGSKNNSRRDSSGLSSRVACRTTIEKMAKKALSLVREALQIYADRGIFHGFNEVRNGQFNFVWLIRHRMELCVDTTRSVLRFKQLLPGIPASSLMYAELKNFIEQLHDSRLPEHRRVD